MHLNVTHFQSPFLTSESYIGGDEDGDDGDGDGYGGDGWFRDAKGDRYGRYICAIISNAVLIFGPCTDRNRKFDHCAVRSESRVLTLYQHKTFTKN